MLNLGLNMLEFVGDHMLKSPASVSRYSGPHCYSTYVFMTQKMCLSSRVYLRSFETYRGEDGFVRCPKVLMSGWDVWLMLNFITRQPRPELILSSFGLTRYSEP